MNLLLRLAGLLAFLVIGTAFMTLGLLVLNPVMDWLGLPNADVLGN